MLKKVLNHFKRVFGVQCPYCGNYLTYTLLDSLGNLIKFFMAYKANRSTYLKINCSECKNEYFINVNRPLELLAHFMLFMGMSFNIFGWPYFLGNYKKYYALIVIILFIYLHITRKVIKKSK